MSNKGATQDDGLIVVAMTVATVLLVVVGMGMAG